MKDPINAAAEIFVHKILLTKRRADTSTTSMDNNVWTFSDLELISA